MQIELTELKNIYFTFVKKKMSKILSIDYGTVRVGLAETDDLQIIATGLDTVPSKEIFEYLKKYFEKNSIEKIIIGEPKQMNGSPSESTIKIEEFIEKLRKLYPQYPIIRIDERFTSKIAFQTMIDSGLSKKKRQNKGLIDEIAATILLQDYLSQK